MTGLLVAGTSSDAGKSLVTVGICRALRRRGIDVAPFKAQNMSNNSMVCRDGAEIGRAQYLQAQAAGVEASSAMNPVLLKPGTDRRSHVVVRGRPAGTLEAGQYATGRRALAEAAFAAFEELSTAHEIVICEGAGSPAEINLRAGDYVNMGLARRFDLPVILVGDIDRGGILASLYGTWAILEPEDRALLSGYVINKFRGDVDVLVPGLEEITRRTGMANLGVLPWLSDIWMDGEDALAVGRWGANRGMGDTLHVAVADFPRISNATDVDALAAEPGVTVTLTSDPQVILGADLAILPGSRSTISDLGWLREHGIDAALRARAMQDLPILGICGGYQMLARTITDEVESSSGTVPGLGLLPVDVVFGEEKTLARPQGAWRGTDVEGYEIHHGTCHADPGCATFLDGAEQGATRGTLWHGTFECDDFRRALLADVAVTTGSLWQLDPTAPTYASRREAMVESLADAVETHLDLDRLLELARTGR